MKSGSQWRYSEAMARLAAGLDKADLIVRRSKVGNTAMLHMLNKSAELRKGLVALADSFSKIEQEPMPLLESGERAGASAGALAS